MTWSSSTSTSILQLDDKDPAETVTGENIPDKDSAETVTGENFADFKRTLALLLNLWYITADKNDIKQNDEPITDIERHDILQMIFSWKQERLYTLSNEKKLKLIQILFIWEEERLKGLSNTEQIELLYELFSLETSDVSSDNKKEQDEKLNILSTAEKDKILQDLFSNNWELDSSFLYKWKGAELYKAISTDKEYPFMKMEIDCLHKLKYNPKFQKIFELIEHVLDIWAWDGQKAVALLDWIDNKWTYIAVDYSRDMLDVAENTIKNNEESKDLSSYVPNLKFWGTFKTNWSYNIWSWFNNVMYLFLWGTICNMTDEDIVKLLKNMDSKDFRGSKILLSYFTAPETKEEIKNLLNIYNSENNRAFHENGMDMLWLSKNDFEFDTVYETDDWLKYTIDTTDKIDDSLQWPFPWRIKWIIRAKTDKKIRLNNGKIIKVKKWQEFTIHYSRRFSEEKIKEIFEQSGCNVILSENEKWEKIVLLNKKSTRIKRFIKKNKKAIYGALAGMVITTAVNITTNKINDNQDNKQKNQKKTEQMLYNQIYNHGNERESGSNLYIQETNELISALSLYDLNDKDRETILELFKVYVSEHKSDSIPTIRFDSSRHEIDSITNQDQVRWFWGKYWSILIDKYNLRHSPYDFIELDMINVTKNLKEEIKYIADRETFGNKVISNHTYIDYGRFTSMCRWAAYWTIDYIDWWNTYKIVKVKIPIWDTRKRVYFAWKKTDNWWYSEFSTNTIEEISNKNWLNPEILSNTANLKENYITHSNIFAIEEPLIENVNKDHIVKMSKLSKTSIKPHMVYLHWERYYFITVPTESWKLIWLASKTLEWEYTTTEFNNIWKYFSDMRWLYHKGNR